MQPKNIFNRIIDRLEFYTGKNPDFNFPGEVEDVQMPEATASSPVTRRRIIGGVAIAGVLASGAILYGHITGGGSESCPDPLGGRVDGDPICRIIDDTIKSGENVESDLTSEQLWGLSQKDNSKIPSFGVALRTVSVDACAPKDSLTREPAKNIKVISISSLSSEKTSYRPIKLSGAQIDTLEASRNTFREYASNNPNTSNLVLKPWTKPQKNRIFSELESKFCDNQSEIVGQMKTVDNQTLAIYDHATTNGHSGNWYSGIVTVLTILGVGTVLVVGSRAVKNIKKFF